MATVALGTTLVLAGAQIARGALPPERFISFFAAVLMLYRPIKQIGNTVHQLTAARASVERVDELLRLSVERRGDGEPPLLPLARCLRLERIWFQYPDALDGERQRALSEIDLELRPGLMVALAGASGAGKTTLANIVAGLERPAGGRLLWDEEDITLAPPGGLRSQVALVPQQPLLMPGTIAENLRYGSPAATEDMLRSAIRRVGLEDLLCRLPGGLKAVLGPRGVQLSAGEAQRLAVARALIRPASLLVLDEPSSALDPLSEARLLQAIDRERQQRAVLVVAHRPEVLAAADFVIELHAGRVVRGGAAEEETGLAQVVPRADGPPSVQERNPEP
jgi:ABC-type multidrug transport system fused ATPase/permease subunit